MKKILLIIPLVLLCIYAKAQVSNDLICNAIDITCGTMVSGSTIGATTTNETALPFCTTYGGITPGVWYRLTGTFPGESIAVNTCTGSTYDTKVHVFSSDNGTCTGNLSCIAGNDDWCALQSRVEFVATSVAGGNYFIYVHGFNASVGIFGLSVACVKISGNPLICAGKSNTLDAGAGFAQYLWSTNETTQTISVSTANTYSVKVTDMNGSTVSGTFTTTVVPNPVCNITSSIHSFSFCEGTGLDLCVQGGYTSYAWKENGSTIGTSNCTTLNHQGTFDVTITDLNGCTSNCSQALTQLAAPVCGITGTLDACGPTTSLCSSSSMSAYLWSTTESTNCITATTASTYTLTITDGNGCKNLNPCHATVTLNNTPDVQAGLDKVVDCHSSTALLDGSSATPNVSLAWTLSNGGSIFSDGNTFTPTVDNTGTYTLTVTNPIGGCTASQDVDVTATPPVPCTSCNNSVIVINQNVTINFNVNPPSYSGDPDLLPYVTYDKSGVNASQWKVVFNIGANKLLVKNGATIKTTQVGSYTPGIEISGTCDLEVEKGGHIIVVSTVKNPGDINIHMNGNIIVNGEIRNEITGAVGAPGAVLLNSQCGDINVGSSGIVETIGEDDGANLVSLFACGSDCNFYGSGDITISGLVKSYAEGNVSTHKSRSPIVRVISLNGFVTVNANTVEPLYDEFSDNGSKYDVYGGILAWTSQNGRVGSVDVQARKSITVNGHGTDPTGPVRRSFGAIAAVGTFTSTNGGLVDVRSLEGYIFAYNRSFDVSGKNTSLSDVANIRLYSKYSIFLSRPGINNNFNPVVDATSPSSGGKGGIIEMRSFSRHVNIGNNVRVYATVPSGSGSVQGINLLESCQGVVNTGLVSPADLIPGNNSGSCSAISTDADFTDCPTFNTHPARLAGKGSSEQIFSTEINVFPNPTNGKITLNFSSDHADKYSLKIISITGTLVHNEMMDAIEGTNEKEIDLSDVAKGIYILILQNNNLKEQKRIIVQ